MPTVGPPLSRDGMKELLRYVLVIYNPQHFFFFFEEGQRKEIDIFQTFFFSSPHMQQIKIVQNDEIPSKVTLSCLCALLLHPVWSLFLLFLLWSLETGFNITMSWNACYYIWRWERHCWRETSMGNNKQVKHAQTALVGGSGRCQMNLICQSNSCGSGYSMEVLWLLIGVTEYKYYFYSNYTYF